MLIEPGSKKNRTSVMTEEGAPDISPIAQWRVTKAEPLENFKLKVRFVDGVEGVVDMANLVHSPRAGVFAELIDPLLFQQVSIEFGTVVWPGDVDLAPDAMYEEIKQKGIWIL